MKEGLGRTCDELLGRKACEGDELLVEALLVELRLLMLHILDLRDPRELGELGGV